MNDKQLVDVLREYEENIFTNLKVASLGEIISENNDGWRVKLVPKINGKDVYLNTINRIKADVSDLIVLLFLDTYSGVGGIVDEKASKHTYSHAVAILNLSKKDDNNE